MSSIPVFYFWMEKINNPKETKRVTSFNYLGDVGEISGDGEWRIIDWTYEEEDWA